MTSQFAIIIIIIYVFISKHQQENEWKQIILMWHKYCECFQDLNSLWTLLSDFQMFPYQVRFWLRERDSRLLQLRFTRKGKAWEQEAKLAKFPLTYIQLCQAETKSNAWLYETTVVRHCNSLVSLEFSWKNRTPWRLWAALEVWTYKTDQRAPSDGGFIFGSLSLSVRNIAISPEIHSRKYHDQKILRWRKF